MAYPDSPFGFIPIRHRSGAAYNGAASIYWIDSADSHGNGTYFIGDVVVLDGSSNSSLIEVPGVGSFPPGTVAGVTKVNAIGTTKVVTGVIVGIAADTRDSLVYRADVTERLVWVADDPDLVFSVQADAARSGDLVGSGANILETQEGDTSTGRSGQEIDATDATGTAAQCIVLRAVNDPLNEVNAVGNRFEVIFALHTMKSAGGIQTIA